LLGLALSVELARMLYVESYFRTGLNVEVLFEVCFSPLDAAHKLVCNDELRTADLGRNAALEA
jgi:hypothetical protein